MQKFVVSQGDLYEFQYRLTNHQRIQKYWKGIIQAMPYRLREEVRTKPTNLHELSENQYQFITKNASQELKDFLKEFVIVVK